MRLVNRSLSRHSEPPILSLSDSRQRLFLQLCEPWGVGTAWDSAQQLAPSPQPRGKGRGEGRGKAPPKHGTGSQGVVEEACVQICDTTLLATHSSEAISRHKCQKCFDGVREAQLWIRANAAPPPMSPPSSRRPGRRPQRESRGAQPGVADTSLTAYGHTHRKAERHHAVQRPQLTPEGASLPPKAATRGLPTSSLFLRISRSVGGAPRSEAENILTYLISN